MKKEYIKKLAILKRHAKLQTEEDVKIFDFVLTEFAEILYRENDSEILSKLIDLFDDECEFPEVMFNIVHVIEKCPKEMLVSIFLKKIKNYKKAQEWFRVIAFGIFNHSPSVAILKQNLYQADQSQLVKFLTELRSTSVRHANLVNELLDKIKSE